MGDEDNEDTADPGPGKQRSDLKEAPNLSRKAASKRTRETARSAPMLSWMRVPVEIKAGRGVPISAVRGLNVGLKDALAKGMSLTYIRAS